jgi:Flp pilus assembly protein TadG
MFKSMQQRLFANARADKAGVILEFALILPLILGITLGAFETARAMRIHQRMSVLSREAANAAFRECSDLPSPSACLNNVLTRMNSLNASGAPGAELVLTIFTYDASTSNVVLAGRAGTDGAGVTSKGNATRYSSANVASNITSLNAQNRVIAISEVFLPYSSVTGTFPGFYKFSKAVFYETTIF